MLLLVLSAIIGLLAGFLAIIKPVLDAFTGVSVAPYIAQLLVYFREGVKLVNLFIEPSTWNLILAVISVVLVANVAYIARDIFAFFKDWIW